MVLSPTVMMLLCLLAVASLAAAIGLLLRDFRRTSDDPDLQFWAGSRSSRKPSSNPWEKEEHGGRIDRAFHALIEGSGRDIDQQTAMAIVAASAIVGCAAPLLLLESLLAGAIGLLVGFSLPLGWWAFCRARRLLAMRNNLPETLELLADSIRAGQTLEQAANLVATSVPAPLNEEFSHCVAQLKLGQPPVAVMQRMSWRIPLPEFRIFTTAVVVHQQTGGNLSLLAHRLAASARDRQQFFGHIRAVTAAGRFSVVGLTVGTFVAVGILAWIRPEYLEAFVSHPQGPSLLLTAAALQLAGIIWVWQTLKVRF